MAQPMVLLGAVHPVAGYLFLELIPDSEVGFADIYQLTDSLYCGDYLVINKPEWRRREPAYDGQPWGEWVIREHLSRIDWYSNESLQRLCHKHNLSCSDLRKWGANLTRWVDIPVMVELDGRHIFITLLQESRPFVGIAS